MKKLSLILIVGLVFTCLPACSKKTPPMAPPTAVSIGIAPFNQPREVSDLLAGNLPDNLPKIDSKILISLDDAFEQLLRSSTTRDYVGSNVSYPILKSFPKKSNISAFNYWTQFGRRMKVEMILVPQIHYWQQRDGGEMGAETPAAAVMDFFLIDINGKRLTRCRFDEQQQSLSSNFLDLGKFLKRGGKWISAEELAKEGMQKAITEFGL